MAASKPTTTKDVAAVEEPKAGDVKYVTVKSPDGTKTTVPEGIVDALLASGYTKSK